MDSYIHIKLKKICVQQKIIFIDCYSQSKTDSTGDNLASTLLPGPPNFSAAKLLFDVKTVNSSPFLQKEVFYRFFQWWQGRLGISTNVYVH